MGSKETPIDQQIAALEAEIKEWDERRNALSDEINELIDKREMWKRDQSSRKDRLVKLYQTAIDNAAQ